MVRDHFGTISRAFSKHTKMGLAIEAETLASLKGLIQAKALSLFNLIVKRDSVHCNILGE